MIFPGKKYCACLAFLIAAAVSAYAQAAPTVTFTLDFPGSDPAHYVLTITSDGKASYQSGGKLASQPEKTDPGDAYQKDFVVSQSTLTRIFDLARRANYFQGDIDSKRKGLASTGDKTLSYQDADKTTHATYNYSPNSSVQNLTELLENISATLEFGRRLDYDLRYQKLALEEQLSRMEDAAKNGSLPELQAVAPTLQQIAADASIVNVARSRAQRLLALAKAAKP